MFLTCFNESAAEGFMTGYCHIWFGGSRRHNHGIGLLSRERVDGVVVVSREGKQPRQVLKGSSHDAMVKGATISLSQICRSQ